LKQLKRNHKKNNGLKFNSILAIKSIFLHFFKLNKINIFRLFYKTEKGFAVYSKAFFRFEI